VLRRADEEDLTRIHGVIKNTADAMLASVFEKIKIRLTPSPEKSYLGSSNWKSTSCPSKKLRASL